jgi:ABC-2 type transport system ATP-binding protein
MATEILKVEGIGKRFGNLEALKGVDLSVREGEFFGFLGPNGAGKSTLMKIMSGFLQPDEGRFFIKGREVVFEDHEARRSFGLVPQEIALYEALSPLENLDAFGRLYRLPKSVIRDRGREVLEAVGLWERRRDRVKDFSGGMKRRLNIIVSLLHEPDILLCDEPTVGVDPQSRNAIFDFLEQMNRQGLTVIYTTHYMEEVERMCPRLAIIDHGKVLACGLQEDLLREGSSRQEVLVRGELASAGLEGRLTGRAEVRTVNGGVRLVPAPETSLATLLAEVNAAGIPDSAIRVRPPSLETLFLELTGRTLRD